MLELAGVAKSRGGRVIIASATFTLAAGNVLCLTGPSGIGKSTLLELMAGVIRPDAGAVTRQAQAALMFQDDVLIPWLTAEENIRFILPPGLDPVECIERAARWLRRFDLEKSLYPAAMSGGMRRRLSLARTFAAARPLILLDEPFAFLDEERQGVVAAEIAAHAAKGCAVALSSHTAEPLSLPCFASIPCRILPAASAPVIIE